MIEDNLEKSENKETETEHLLQARNTNGNENKDLKIIKHMLVGDL